MATFPVSRGDQEVKVSTLPCREGMEAQDAEWVYLTESIAPYRSWTTGELCELLEADPPLTPESLRLLMLACREFDGEIWEMRPRREPATDQVDVEPPPRRTYVDPWPDAVAGLGPRTVEAYEPCAECGEGSWARYGRYVLCLRCARRREAA